MYTSFTDALMQAKRASQLRGTPFSTADVRNLRSSYSMGAAERSAGERSEALAERSQTAQETNWANTLAQEKDLANQSRNQTRDIAEQQLEAADKAANKALVGNVVSTGASLAGGAAILKGMAPTAANATLTGVETAAPVGLTTGATELAVGATPLTGATQAALGIGTAAAAGGVGGYVGGKAGVALGESIKEIPGGQKEQATVGGAAAGAGAAIAAGAAMGAPAGPAGIAVGATVGAITGLVTGGTVICTELRRQGYLNDEVYEGDKQYRSIATEAEYRGYRILADPIVEKMQKSRLFTWVVSLLGVPTATEMAHRVNPEIKGTLIGKIMLWLFIPICRNLGMEVEQHA